MLGLLAPISAHPRSSTRINTKLGELVPVWAPPGEASATDSITDDPITDTPNAGDDVFGVAIVIYKDTGPGDGQRVVVGHVRGRCGQAVGVLEHAGRADGQRVEGVGQLGRLALAGGVAEVPAAEDSS